jgi:predicted DCC family thiol-disulfide oxidoreductase YuxK
MIFDGDCRFCRLWIERWRQTTGDRVEYTPFQDPSSAEQFPELERTRLERAVHYVEPTGEVFSGAEAAFRALAMEKRWPLWLYQNVPGVVPVCEAAYRLVARNRSFSSLLTRLLVGQSVERPTHLLVRSLFLRSLGLVYLIAFVSLGTQVLGLIGSNGILPVPQLMHFYKQQMPEGAIARYLSEPTLCWWSVSDASLRWQCRAGAVLSLLLIAGVAPVPCLLLLWLLYLSLVTVGNIFLGYQWDNLLLETGLLAIFFAPFRPWLSVRHEHEPSRIALWLLRWLLFRLMFASGCVKLLSGDVAWRNFTALTYHYETQPLPTWAAWYAHQLPAWLHKASALAMFGVELVVPFLVFLPRRARFVAFWLFVVFQAGIAVTGNYTFFNLLSIVLCLPLLDDRALLRFLPANWRERLAHVLNAPRLPPRRAVARGRLALVSAVALLVLTVTGIEIVGMFRGRMKAPSILGELYQHVAVFRSINNYGLFAVMTTSRPEIVVEGSNDGRNWERYEFKYKPGDVKRRPRFVAPHQPRLDWQMWFAALNPNYREPWFMNFATRLLQGSPEVLVLLEQNPFPAAPPRSIRASLYEYHFTDSAMRKAEGSWWRREFKGFYCPPISLRAVAATPASQHAPETLPAP